MHEFIFNGDIFCAVAEPERVNSEPFLEKLLSLCRHFAMQRACFNLELFPALSKHQLHHCK